MGLVLEFEGDFGGTLASLWDQCWYMRVTLGSLWGHFGVALGPLGGHFGYMVVTLVHFGITMGRLWSHFGYTKVCFQKTRIFPTDFNDFIKLWSYVGVALGSPWDNLSAYEGDFVAILAPF